jgi:DNA helicase-2/ATP-dependent DNA helicase PcrA
MELFAEKFHADRIELTENFRSSAAVVHAAQALEPSYTLEGQLAIPGLVQVLVADDEPAESELISQEITRLIRNGHPDVEGPITPGRCAVLGRNRYLLMVVERELRKCEIACYQRVSPTHEYESDLATEFQLALRIYANPGDRFHLAALAKTWGLTLEENLSLDKAQEFRAFLSQWASNQQNPPVVLPSSARQAVVAESIAAIAETEVRNQRLDLMPGIAILRKHADGLEDEPRRAIYNDTEVLRLEWDQYLRSRTASARSIGGFLGQMALGTTQALHSGGVALLTVHSAKGLEFDVVFVVGMVDGVFPDYRARNNSRAQREERRNAFVAMTRSRRLLYLSYPRTRMMPWGEVWANQPSPYLTKVARKK